MKKLYLLYLAMCIVSMSFGQVVSKTKLPYAAYKSGNEFPALKSANLPSIRLTSKFTAAASGQINALLLIAERPDWVSGVQSEMMSTGLFNVLDVMNFEDTNGLPTVQQLQNYDAVLVWADFRLNDTMGDTLAIYIDGGGGVVSAVFNLHTNWGIEGTRFNSDYLLLELGTYSPAASLGTINIPAHPIMEGILNVSSPNNYKSNSTAITSGSVVVAGWSDGIPAIVVKEGLGSSNARRADINYFPPDMINTTDDAAKLLANALIWVSKKNNCADVVVDNDPGTCGSIVNYTEPTAEGATVTQIDASGLTNGDEFPVGTTLQQYQFDFGGGVLDTCTFNVTVNDVESPVISCPADITVFNDPGECGAIVSYRTLIGEVIDEVLPGSLSEWVVYDNPNNPIFHYEEITSPFDGTTAIKTSAVGNTVMYCSTETLTKVYNISGNTDITKLKAYLEFASNITTYNFPYILIQLYDEDDNNLGLEIFYGKGMVGSYFANSLIPADQAHYTELPSASGDMILDLSKIGENIDFKKISIKLSNYTCIGENSIIFDHLRVINSSLNGGTGNASVIASDNCSGVSVEANIPSGNLFPVGTTPVTLTATDAAGNTTSCSFNVTVEDTIAPVFECPADIEVSTNPGETCATVIFPSISSVAGDEAQPGITLPNAQINQGGVAYNPDKKLYYAVQAGSTGYTLYTYDENGAQLAGNTAEFDFRGLWWNPNTSSLEGNSYAGFEGYRRVDLDANGYALSTGTNDPASNYQPNDQSQADYDYDLDEVIYFYNNTIYRTSRSTGELIGNTEITGLPANTTNWTFVGYTGIAGKEVIIYDYVNKMVYFIDKATGIYSSSVQLPDSAPGQEYLNTSYANGHIWISDGTLWHSYKIVGNFEDNCGTATVTYDYPSGTCFPIGTTEITLTVADEADNKSTCSFNVTVIESANINLPPVIVSADEVYVWAGDSVTLDASETWDPNGDIIDFKWTHYYYAFLDKVILFNPNDPQLSFIAPEVDELTLMPIRLRVSDGLESSVLIIKVYVKARLNNAPLAHAGEDLMVNERESGMLDGTASSDVDGNPLTYLWNSGFLTLDDVASPTPAFVAPEVYADTTVWVTLVVNDGKMDSEADSVQITIKQVNRMPVADAGVNVTVNEGEQVTFNASGSSDPEGDVLTYKWSADGLTITNNDKVSANLIAPEVEEDTTVPVVLVVNDGEMNSAPDTIWVTILQVNKMPVWVQVPADTAFVGKDFSATIKVTDPDNLDVLSIFSDELPDWLMITDHGDGTATISTDSVPRLESLLGTHTFVLKASDGTVSIDTLLKLTITIKTGITDWQLAKLSVYPNPTNGIVHIDFNRLPAMGTLLQVYNQLGQSIAVRQIDEQNSFIDLSAHPAGMYYFKVNSDGTTHTEKIIRR